MDDQASALSQTAAAMLLLAVLLGIFVGSIVTFVLLRGHYRRHLARTKPRQHPPTLDPWTESARRLDPPADDLDSGESNPDHDGPGDDENDDDNHDDDDDDDDGEPSDPIPSSPSMSASC